MRYYFFLLEIMDGEHGYYRSGVLSARNMESADKKALRCAKQWYESEKTEPQKNSKGEVYGYEFVYQGVICSFDSIREISKEHYDILKQYL